MKQIDFQVKGDKSRRELRKIVVNKFLEEEPGIGSGDLASKYTYYVETLKNGDRVNLTRPAWLKKGFDFRINVENTVFMAGRDVPKHEDIIDDLKKKKAEDKNKYNTLLAAIEEVWECKDTEIICERLNIKFRNGFSCELILKTLKWLFIEQDIRDWNYSGRAMLINGIREI